MLRTSLATCGLLLLSATGIAADVTYRKDIRPVWITQCSACHDTNSPYLGEFEENKKAFEEKGTGPRMDTYADLIFYVGWPDTGALMRRLDDGKTTADGKPGNMYRYLGGSTEERQRNLALFKEWVGTDAWKHNRWQPRGNVPAITKEEMDKIKVKY